MSDTARAFESKVHQTGLVRVQLEDESPQPLAQQAAHPLTVEEVFEHHDEIVTEPHQGATTLHPRLHHLVEPFVQHIVQMDIGEQGRNHAPCGVPVQIDSLGLRRLSIHAHRTVLARLLIGMALPLDIQIPVQRCERHLPVTSRQFGYPFLFR